jgi:hypothetical protein
MGGDPAAPSTNESTAEMMRAYNTFLPRLLSTTARALPNYVNTVSPQLAETQANLYSEYGPRMLDTANQINRSAAMSQAESDRDVLGGPGRDLIRQANEAQRETDPEYYALREATSGTLQDLLKPELSGGERTEIERYLNKENAGRGTLNTPTATSTVSNAMTFGNSLRERLGSAINLSNQSMPNMRSGVDPFQVATGRSSAALGLADSKFGGVGSDAAQAGGMANNMFGQIGALQQQQADINSQRRDSLDRMTGVIGSLPSVS